LQGILDTLHLRCGEILPARSISTLRGPGFTPARWVPTRRLRAGCLGRHDDAQSQNCREEDGSSVTQSQTHPNKQTFITREGSAI